MREIKFRGKREDFRNWIYFDMMHHLFDDSGLPPDFLQYHLDIKTIGQFTGLKDKNETEIYEGDIVIQNIQSEYLDVSDWTQVKGVVSHTNGLWCVKGEHYPLFAFENEVIGNIHENPELLTT